MREYEGVELSSRAIANVEEAGVSPADDLDDIRVGKWTRETLLEYCLDGVEEDRQEGWYDYVDALFELVGPEGS